MPPPNARSIAYRVAENLARLHLAEARAAKAEGLPVKVWYHVRRARAVMRDARRDEGMMGFWFLAA